MADQSGRKIAVGLGRETTRGTSVTPAYWVSQETTDFQNKSDFIMQDTVFGVLNKNSAADIVKDYAEGKIDGNVTDASFGLILYALFGTDTPALKGGETVVYNHTFSQNQSNTPQSLTITRSDTNGDKRYARGMLKSLEINVVTGEYAKFSTDWVSQNGVTSTDTVAYVLENRFKSKYAVAKMATTTGGLSGATAIPMKSFKLTVTRKVNPYWTFGSNTPNEIFVEEWDSKGEFVLRYTDTTYEVPHYANTLQALSVTLANTDVTIGASSNPTLAITLPEVTLNEWKVNENKESITEQTVGFTGLYNFGSSSEVQAILTNLVASY